jgi:hypothetical protein
MFSRKRSKECSKRKRKESAVDRLSGEALLSYQKKQKYLLHRAFLWATAKEDPAIQYKVLVDEEDNEVQIDDDIEEEIEDVTHHELEQPSYEQRSFSYSGPQQSCDMPVFDSYTSPSPSPETSINCHNMYYNQNIPRNHQMNPKNMNQRAILPNGPPRSTTDLKFKYYHPNRSHHQFESEIYPHAGTTNQSYILPSRRRGKHVGLYTPKEFRGTGDSREGLCPLCPTPTWYRMRTSIYWYHMNIVHGVSAKTGTYYDAPLSLICYHSNKAPKLFDIKEEDIVFNGYSLPSESPMGISDALLGVCSHCEKWIFLFQWPKITRTEHCPYDYVMLKYDELVQKYGLGTQDLAAEFFEVLRQFDINPSIWFKHLQRCSTKNLRKAVLKLVSPSSVKEVNEVGTEVAEVAEVKKVNETVNNENATVSELNAQPETKP